jgi:hypothetical protein
MKKLQYLAMAVIVGFSVAANATPITFSFLENGSNLTLGNTSTFHQSGATLTAWASPGQILYAKNQSAGEQGLGINSDPTGDHEIWGQTFVSILSSTVTGFEVNSISFGSTTGGEIADIWFSTTLGSLGTLIGAVTSNTTFAIGSLYQNGYISVSSPNGNVLLGSATGINIVTTPDGASTVALLGGSMMVLGLIRRKLKA